MSYEVNGQTLEADANGFLLNTEEWSEDVAQAIAAKEGIELTEKHWDMINYLRDEYLNNGSKQPNMRTIVKAMQEKWDDKSVDAKSLYQLFPLNPDKQASKIGGLPDTKRKGGY
jgi:tRNA 2-thiouridine synthesizing protein E